MVSLDEVVDRLEIDEEQVRGIARVVLEFRKDYRPARGKRLLFTEEAVAKLQDAREGVHAARDGDNVQWARVCRQLPPNERFVWITGDGFSGRGTCSIPTRWKRKCRIPGKRIRVRRVEGNLFKLVT